MPQVGKGLGAIAGKLNGLDPDSEHQAHDTASRKIRRFLERVDQDEKRASNKMGALHRTRTAGRA
jgi:hypothetical protein